LFKGIRNPKKRAFLAAFSRSGQIVKAAKRAKIHWSSHYVWLSTDPTYVQAFGKARDVVADRLEGEVLDSAFRGDQRVVTFEGEVTAKYRQKSDIMRIFALKGLKPEYRDNFSLNQFTGPVQVNVKFSSNTFNPLEQTSLPTEPDEAQVIEDKQ
jgi:hypothetical protein